MNEPDLINYETLLDEDDEYRYWLEEQYQELLDDWKAGKIDRYYDELSS